MRTTNTQKSIYPEQSLQIVAELSSQSFKNFDAKLAVELTRFEKLTDSITNRRRRELALNVSNLLRKIRLNCQSDPLDIKEESTLPVVVKEMADSLFDFATIIPHRVPAQFLSDQEKLVDKMLVDAGTWLEQILERMLTNDKQGLAIRVQTLSSVFERGSRLHKVQQEIRASVEENKEKQ